MATEFQEEEKKDEEQQQQIVGGTQTTPGASTPGGVYRPQEGSGRVTNVRRYLEANQPFRESTGGLAGAISEKASQQTQQAQTGLSKAQEQFGQQASGIEQQLGEQAGQTIQTAFKDPSKILQQQDQLQQFQQLRDQGFQQQIGQLQPSLSPYEQQAQQLQQQAQSAGTEAGRFQLLRDAFGSPSYTKGQQRLDQLFLQAQPGQARGLQSQLGDLATQAQSGLTAAQEQMAAKQAALQELSGQRAQEIQNLLQYGTTEGLETELGQRGLSDIEQDIEARLGTTQEQAAGELASLRSRLESGKLSAEDISALGLQQGQALFNLPLQQYVSEQIVDPTKTQIASPEEYARYQALSQLAGADQTFFGGPEAQAGTYNPYEISKERLGQDIADKRQTFTQEFAPEAFKAERFSDLGDWVQSVNNINPYDSRQMSNLVNKAQELGLGKHIDNAITWAKRNAKSPLGNRINPEKFKQELFNEMMRQRDNAQTAAMSTAREMGATAAVGGQLSYSDLLNQFANEIWGGTGRGGEALPAGVTGGTGKGSITGPTGNRVIPEKK